MSQQHIKNHYVPELYLKRWATNKKVQVYRTLVSHSNVPLWKAHSLSAVGYQKHFYTQIISGKESDEFERWLDKEIESPANEVIEKVVLDQRLNQDDWYVLIRFLALQDVRTPARLFEHLERTQKDLKEILNSILLELKEEGFSKEDIEQLNNGYIAQNAELFPVKVSTSIEEGEETGILKAETYAGRSTWIYSIKHLIENTSKVLHGHKWTILKPAKGYSWFTSDNPVIKLIYYGKNKYDLKGGWGNEKGNIIFPLGPNHAMFSQIGTRSPLRGTRISKGETIELRKYIAENAYRLIFSNTEDGLVPVLRPRVIDALQVKREKEQFAKWHEENSRLEREFFKSNINA